MSTTLQQEILLMTGTTFSERICWQKNEYNKEQLSEVEQIQEACCNGILPQILPEICNMHESQKLFLWQIRENETSIGIELGEYPEIMEKSLSIDPYLFITIQLLN